MEEFNKILDRANPAALLRSRQSTAEIIMWPLRGEEPDTAIRILRGKWCSDTTSFLRQIAAVFQFPDYYGENWGAMDECINDLTWLPANRYVLMITNVDHLLEKEDLKQTEILFEILIDAAERWNTGENSPPNSADKKYINFSIILHIEQNAEIPKRLQDEINTRHIPIITIPPTDNID